MNICYLPNELLVDILDRLDAGSVLQCSEINKRFYNVIKTHKLFKPVANSLTIRWEVENGCLTNIVEIIAKVVLGERTVEIKRLISVEENKTEDTEDKIIAVLKKFRISTTRIFGMNTNLLNIDRILRAANINLSQLHEFSSHKTFIPLALVDNSTLENLVKNKTQEVYLHCSTTSITIDAVLTAIQQLSTFPEKFTWNLGLIKTGELTDEECFELYQMIEKRISIIEGAEFSRFFYTGVLLKKTKSRIRWTFNNKWTQLVTIGFPV